VASSSEEDDDEDVEDDDVERATWASRAWEARRAVWAGWNERVARWWDGRAVANHSGGEREDRSR
jgi:hypothetical protein